MQSAPIVKGGPNDFTSGIVKNRKCTDVLFCILFLAHVVVLFVIGLASFAGGNPNRLIAGQDYQGAFCGLSGSKTFTGQDVSSFSNVFYTMNVTADIELLAGSFFASNDVSSAATALSPSALIGDSGQLLGDISSYLTPVCMASCPPKFTLSNSSLVASDASWTSNQRTYVWEGPTNPAYQTAWANYVASGASMALYTYPALPFSKCPYDAKYCVPLIGVDTTSVLNRYCVPMVPAAGDVAAYIPSSYSGTVSSGIGSYIGDLKTSWPATALVVLFSVAVSMGFLLLMRCCVGVIIWGAIILCFGILVAGGGVLYLYSNLCLNGALIPMQSSCANGYSITSSAVRSAMLYTAYTVWILAGVYSVIILCLCKRIRLGVAINKVAAQFIRQNMTVILVPLVQAILGVIWIALWCVFIIYSVSNVPSTYRDLTDSWSSWSTAVSTCGDASNVFLNSTIYSATYTTTSVYACKPARYVVDYKLYYEFFSLLWVNAFLIACGQCMIAGAVGIWYFTPNADKGGITGAVPKGVFNCLTFHTGTMAFGSFILAVVQFIKWYLRYLQEQGKKTGNTVMRIVAMILGYCVACFERFIQFLNKNAYIQTALCGTAFCTSAKNAFFLILRNAVRIAVLAGIGGAVNLLGVCFITSGTALGGYFILQYMYGNQIGSILLPMLVYICIGYIVSKLVMNVFALAIDTILQCYVADEEIHKQGGDNKCTPTLLKDFMTIHAPKKKDVGDDGGVDVDVKKGKSPKKESPKKESPKKESPKKEKK